MKVIKKQKNLPALLGSFPDSPLVCKTNPPPNKPDVQYPFPPQLREEDTMHVLIHNKAVS